MQRTLAASSRLIDNYYDNYFAAQQEEAQDELYDYGAYESYDDEDGAYFDEEGNEMYDAIEEGYYDDEDYGEYYDDEDYDGEYYDDEYYGDDGDYYYDEALQAQIAALQSYYDAN